MIAQQHPQQQQRLKALHRYEILDTERESAFDEVTKLAAAICDAPISVINFIDAERQWFKSEVGLGVRSTPLDTSLCSHVILEGDFVEIPDTLLDCRMSDNPLCTGEPSLRFYAGATLRTEDGLPLGTLCILDHKPRTLTALQRETLRVLATQVMRQLDLRLALKREEVLRREIDHRVKNSLASVAALISMQTARSENADVKDALGAINGRLSALIALHEELHLSGDGGDVDLRQFVGRAAAMLGSMLPSGVRIEVDVEPVAASAEFANSVGIILNEFVTNASKYAFGERIGLIRVEGRSADEGYRLTLCDNGAADKKALERIRTSKGLGARIIAAAARSAGGAAEWSVLDPGLQLRVVCKLR